MSEKIKYQLTIKPAIPPVVRHKIQDILRVAGYHVIGGGQMMDGSVSDISFENGVLDGQKEADH